MHTKHTNDRCEVTNDLRCSEVRGRDLRVTNNEFERREDEVNVYECFGTGGTRDTRVSRVRASYANRRRTSRARVDDEILLSVQLCLYVREFESDDKRFENVRNNLE